MDLVLLGTALLLGAVHTFDADHVAAVSAFVVRRPTVEDALGYGLRWALGHGGIILLVGSAWVLLGLHLPESSGGLLERLVGASLVVLGGWVFWTAHRLHAHEHRHGQVVHTHLHAHPPRRPPHEHRHAATAMGALHGLAGTAPAVALIPLTTLESAGPAFAYLAVFGVGTALSMALYAMFAGWAAGRVAHRSGALGRALARTAGLGSVAVGLVWLVRSF